MASPIYSMFNRNPQPGIMAQFRQFRDSFKGDPKAKVQELLNSGQMTQAQYNQLCNKAQELMRMMK